jgi:hypothetical protein
MKKKIILVSIKKQKLTLIVILNVRGVTTSKKKEK